MLTKNAAALFIISFTSQQAAPNCSYPLSMLLYMHSADTSYVIYLLYIAY